MVWAASRGSVQTDTQLLWSWPLCAKVMGEVFHMCVYIIFFYLFFFFFSLRSLPPNAHVKMMFLWLMNTKVLQSKTLCSFSLKGAFSPQKHTPMERKCCGHTSLIWTDSIFIPQKISSSLRSYTSQRSF